MKIDMFLRSRPGLLPLVIGVACLLALIGSVQAQTPSLTFTMQTTTPDGRQITPKLTWSTTPAATSCTASGSTTWTGTKAAAGEETLAPISTTTSYSISCVWPGSLTALVKWIAPTELEDNTPLTDLAGFRVLYGTNQANLDQFAVIANPATREWRSGNLAPGTWWFAVRAYRTNGLESLNSSPLVSGVIVASTSQSRTLEVAVKFPKAATGVTVTTE